MGVIGGGVFQAIKGFRNAPVVSRGLPWVEGGTCPAHPTQDTARKTAWSCHDLLILVPASLLCARPGSRICGLGRNGKHGPVSLAPSTQLGFLCENAVLSKRSSSNPKCMCEARETFPRGRLPGYRQVPGVNWQKDRLKVKKMLLM